jgi:hypothetical protein
MGLAHMNNCAYSAGKDWSNSANWSWELSSTMVKNTKCIVNYRTQGRTRIIWRSIVVTYCNQGSYGSCRKTWKVMEFQYSKIQAWKSWKINFSHVKSWKIEILHKSTKYFTYFNLPVITINMNFCYITDFCKSEVNFVLLLYLLSLKY